VLKRLEDDLTRAAHCLDELQFGEHPKLLKELDSEVLNVRNTSIETTLKYYMKRLRRLYRAIYRDSETLDLDAQYSSDRRETLYVDYFSRIDEALKELERLISNWIQAKADPEDFNSSLAAEVSKDDIDPIERDMLQHRKRLRELHNKFRPRRPSAEHSFVSDEPQERRSRKSVQNDHATHKDKDRQDSSTGAKAPRAKRDRSRRDSVHDYIYDEPRDRHHSSR